MTWKIFGHEPAKKILELQLKSGRLPHSYLFLGPSGVGKKALALEFAARLLQTENVYSHPDFLFFDAAAQSGIEPLRDFMATLTFRPVKSLYRLAIIDAAESLNTQSQNALLKTLEEPAAGTVLLLVSCKPLLSTIISRCQVLRFNRFSQGQMENFVKSLGNKASVTLNYGLPGRAENNSPQYEEQTEVWKKLILGQRGERLCAVAEWAEKEAGELNEIFESLLWWEMSNLKVHPENYFRPNALMEAQSALGRNLNKKLVLQKLFLSL